MPRATQSKEAQILDYFKHAPLAVAVLVVGLVRDIIRARQPKVAPAKVAPKKVAAVAPKVAASKAATPAKTPVKPAAKPQKRKSRAKKHGARGQAALHSAGGQLEDLGPDSQQE